MSSTKRLKHISMMLLWEDVEYVENKLCQSHGDLSHIFRNVFHNFVLQLKSSEKITAEAKNEEQNKNENTDSTNTKSKTKKSKSSRTKKLKDSATGGGSRKGRK